VAIATYGVVFVPIRDAGAEGNATGKDLEQVMAAIVGKFVSLKKGQEIKGHQGIRCVRSTIKHCVPIAVHLAHHHRFGVIVLSIFSTGDLLKWMIEDNCRCDLAFYSGVNCSGTETIVRVFPKGRKGEIHEPFNSVKVASFPGLRVFYCTSIDEEAWWEEPWRCVQLMPGMGIKAMGGLNLVRVHDLDQYNEPDALARPPDTEVGFPEVSDPNEGEGWTFGMGAGSLKGRIRMIIIVRVD
jgi:hypothetical protein